MTNKTNSFKFYSNFLDAINVLPENERANACYEFCKYGITGDLPKDKAIAMFCVGVSVSVQKYQGRGGNHNPTGKNQWSKEVKEVKVGQTGQNEQTETETKNLNKEIYKESFDLFWEEYPKKRAGSKQKAYQAYCKAIKEKRATEEQILQSVQNYKTCDEVKRGYAKGCAAWLNDDRFNNEYVPEKEQSEMTEEELLAWGRG